MSGKSRIISLRLVVVFMHVAFMFKRGTSNPIDVPNNTETQPTGVSNGPDTSTEKNSMETPKETTSEPFGFTTNVSDNTDTQPTGVSNGPDTSTENNSTETPEGTTSEPFGFTTNVSDNTETQPTSVSNEPDKSKEKTSMETSEGTTSEPCSSTTNVSGEKYKRVCYVTNWAQYRPLDGKFMPKDIDPTLCSHINYAFAILNDTNDLVSSEWNDEVLYEQLNVLKKINPSLKTLISVGGGNFGMAKVSIMLSNATNRQKFIDQAIAFCREHNFDGLDLDFEYPANLGSPPEDRHNFVFLLLGLRAAFQLEATQTGRTTLLLTVAVGAGKDVIDTAYDVPAIAEVVDWINLLSYDLHGSWESQTGINAPLYNEKGNPTETLNLNFVANYWVSLGCPNEKLVLGMATYGRGFTLADAANNIIGAPTVRPSIAGNYTQEAGFLSYYEICDLINSPGAVTVYDKDQQVPYSTLGDQWIGYDNEQSLTAKIDYMVAGGYGGFMVWTLDLDDFTGTHCNAAKNPLLTTLNKLLIPKCLES